MRNELSFQASAYAMLLFAVLVACWATPSTAASLRADSKGSEVEGTTFTQHLNVDLNAGARNAVGEGENLEYLLKTVAHFKNFAMQNNAAVAVRHNTEAGRLAAAVDNSQEAGVKLALGQSITSNQQSLLETQRVYGNMIKFADSVETLLRSVNMKGASCDHTMCGDHASCTMTTAGPQCVCNEGYVGTGTDCHAPPEFMPHPLIEESKGTQAVHAADLSVAVFGGNRVVVAYRDVTSGGVGKLIMGSVGEAGRAHLNPPTEFTEDHGKAFNPVVIGSANNRVAVAWRDESQGGNAWVRGAAMGLSGIRGSEMALSFGKAVSVSKGQAHKMALVGLPDDRIALMFSDKIAGSGKTPEQSFGNSILADVGPDGTVSVLGNFRFSDEAVCRLEITKITPSSFILAARGAPAVDDMDSSATTKQEALAIYGELIDNELVFDPNKVNLEPSETQIWARGVSLIAPNTFAYAYQEGQSLDIKMSVVHIDPNLKRMQKVAGPTVVHKGFSPYVQMLSVPYTPSDPHTLVYFEDGDSSTLNLCSWDVPKKEIDRCEDFTWLSRKLTSVAGVHIGGGKSFMVFTTESGDPYYTVFGLSKK